MKTTMLTTRMTTSLTLCLTDIPRLLHLQACSMANLIRHTIRRTISCLHRPAQLQLHSILLHSSSSLRRLAIPRNKALIQPSRTSTIVRMDNQDQLWHRIKLTHHPSLNHRQPLRLHRARCHLE